jgi:hypothetical protein
LVIVGGLIAACGPSGQHTQPMMSMKQMPVEVQQSGPAVQEAYQFAAGNREIVKQIPCYCGCASLGHSSNYDCYVKAVSTSGEITYDLHTVYCTICIDVTQDTMRLFQDGRSPEEIRAYVDRGYTYLGQSTGP